MQHQQRLIQRADAGLRACEMATEDFFLADVWIGEESVRGFGVRPILARQRDGSSNSIGHQAQQRTQALPQSHVAKVPSVEFLLNPGLILPPERGFPRLFGTVLCGLHPQCCTTTSLQCTYNTSEIFSPITPRDVGN